MTLFYKGRQGRLVNVGEILLEKVSLACVRVFLSNTGQVEFCMGSKDWCSVPNPEQLRIQPGCMQLYHSLGGMMCSVSEVVLLHAPWLMELSKLLGSCCGS